MDFNGAAEQSNAASSLLEGPCRLRPVLVFRHKTRPGGFTRLAHPDLAIWVQTAAAGGRNGGEPRAMQQASIGNPAVRVQAAMIGHHLVPGRLARLENARIRKRRAVEFILVQVCNNLVTVLNEGDRSAKAGFRADMTDDEADRSAGETRIRHQ